MIIYSGCLLIWIGLIMIVTGIEAKLNKKMENNSDYKFSVATLSFAKGFVDDNGEPIKPINYIKAEKIEGNNGL